MSPVKLWSAATDCAASCESRIVSLKKQWPVALLSLGVVLTFFWIVLVTWIPVHIVSSLVLVSLRDLFQSVL